MDSTSDDKECDEVIGWHSNSDTECSACDKRSKAICKIFAIKNGWKTHKQIMNRENDLEQIFKLMSKGR